MRIDIEQVKDWFGYDRKERRASFILIILIVLVISARMFVPGSDINISEVTMQLIYEETSDSFSPGPSFFFDPNIASYDTLLLAGLEEKEARTLISYRNKGGRFRIPGDIRKLYGVDSVEAERLMPHISIRQDTVYKISYGHRKLLELNIADSAMLEKLPGIGPVLSARIVRYRNLLGGFVSVNQLREVYGLPPETFEMIRSLVYTDSSMVEKININEADYNSLMKIPYLRRYNLNDIVKFRELEGRITSVSELVENDIIPDSLASKIRPYLLF